MGDAVLVDLYTLASRAAAAAIVGRIYYLSEVCESAEAVGDRPQPGFYIPAMCVYVCVCVVRKRERGCVMA